MLYVIHAIDKPGHSEVRLANRDAHVEYVTSQSIKLVLAGPLLAEDHKTSMGTLLIIDARDMMEARAFADNDPYNRADLFSDVKITAWRKTVGWND